MSYRTVTALEWKCCPGFTGSNCDEGECAGTRGQGTGRWPGWASKSCVLLPLPSSSEQVSVPSHVFLPFPNVLEPNAPRLPPAHVGGERGGGQGAGRVEMEETQGRGFDSQPVFFTLALTHPETRAGRAGSLDSEQMQARAHSLEARSALDDGRWTWWVAAKGEPCRPPLPFCLAGAQREDGGWGSGTWPSFPRWAQSGSGAQWGQTAHSGKQGH